VARLGLIVLFLVLLMLATAMLVRGLGRMMRRVDEGRNLDMAGDGMLPKLAYGLLIALIVYATLTASGA